MRVYWAVSIFFALNIPGSYCGPDFVIEYSDKIADARGERTYEIHQSCVAEDTVRIIYGIAIIEEEYDKAKEAFAEAVNRGIHS